MKPTSLSALTVTVLVRELRRNLSNNPMGLVCPAAGRDGSSHGRTGVDTFGESARMDRAARSGTTTDLRERKDQRG